MATSAETKSIFRPARCRLTGDHFVECPGTQVESVYGRREHLKQDYLFTHFHEREVADALLAINHYRFLDAGDVLNKCSRATAFKADVEKREAEMEQDVRVQAEEAARRRRRGRSRWRRSAR